MTEPGQLPEGFTVDAVDWLPSGAKSGLVRVRGHRPAAVAGPLPELILEAGDTTRRYVSLPDPRADRDPTAWRGAYVLEARPAAEADRLWLEWPGSRRIELPPLTVPPHQVARDAESESEVASAEVVVDRAVLAERRARRAEASEQAQAKIAREAMRAVEVLELRMAELEQRALVAEGERDALRGQVQPDVDTSTLTQELAQVRAELAEREAELARRPESAADLERIPATEAERRAERLRTALTATVTTVGELRLRLHEVQVARRTRDVVTAADAVRLAVIDRERGALKAALDEARARLERAVAARDEAVAELQGVRNAHEDLRGRFGDLSAELGGARERVAELESEVAAVTAVAERSAAEAMEAARAEAAALATEQAHDTEAEMAALRARLATAEASIAAAETARELAEARAFAATADRRAAAVAAAATPLSSPKGGQSHPKATSAAPPRVSEALIAAERQVTEESDRIAADLDAAREALRAVEPAPSPAIDDVPSPEPLRQPATIISEAKELPNDLARGRAQRDLPPLRGALVKLAHDDPAAAGRILAGLLKAQHAALTETPPDYDLTITEVGTFAVSSMGQTTLVSALDAPRGRPHAAFHLTADALTLAESVSGTATKARRRRGPVRATGKVRAARRLTESVRETVSLKDLLKAGAEIEPGLVLRGFAYAVRPAWTQGQQWRVDILLDDAVFAIVANHTGGLTVEERPSDGEADVSIRLTADQFRELVAGDLPEPAADGDERVLRRLLSLAERARTGAD